MSIEIDDREFKQIKYVWILNLLPPGSGMGTVYGCGTISFALVLLSWFYISCNFSLETIFDIYILTSTLGTIGCVVHNLSLKKIKQNLDDESIAEYPEPIEIPVHLLPVLEVDSERPTLGLGNRIATFETDEQLVEKTESIELQSNLVHPDSPNTILQESTLDSFSSENDLDSRLSKVLDQSPIQNNQALQSSSDSELEVKAWRAQSQADQSETSDFSEPETKQNLEAEAEESFDNSDGTKTEILPEPKSLEVSQDGYSDGSKDEDLDRARQKLLDRLGEATGEIQLDTDALGKYENVESVYKASNFDFNLPTNFETNFAYSSQPSENGITESGMEVAHCECGSQINSSFSFCLSCGKIFS